MVGPVTAVSLFPAVVPGSHSSATSACFAERSLAACLQRSLSIVARGYQLGRIAADVCPQYCGEDWTSRAGLLHQPFWREGTSGRVLLAGAGEGDSSAVALGDTAAAFANGVLFGFG